MWNNIINNEKAAHQSNITEKFIQLETQIKRWL
jgi:hypothetical protein